MEAGFIGVGKHSIYARAVLFFSFVYFLLNSPSVGNFIFSHYLWSWNQGLLHTPVPELAELMSCWWKIVLFKCLCVYLRISVSAFILLFIHVRHRGGLIRKAMRVLSWSKNIKRWANDHFLLHHLPPILLRMMSLTLLISYLWVECRPLGDYWKSALNF